MSNDEGIKLGLYGRTLYPEEIIMEKFNRLNEQMLVVTNTLLRIDRIINKYGVDIMRIQNQIEHLIEDEDEAGGSCESDLY